ncbi:hypothetical protein PNA2_0341 [Pyrococcus sp. NA2]|uniref:hypothetical protein n=1 Tax=Pyrococcus sp. (strain NA2) TaxID=342949 RepID=UPI000209A904|nr:hypothetical protein [Pyrococcus sp. NA2]AEC51258.1 hypothetical protein PNA2_0341 [Pyrococcus sp. NA2]
MEEDESNSFWGRIFRRRNKEEVLEQRITEDVYEELKTLLMRAKPEIKGSEIIVHLPKAEVILNPKKLIIKAPSRHEAEKILRNIHHYSQPPGLWPAYGLTYSIKREKSKIS